MRVLHWRMAKGAGLQAFRCQRIMVADMLPMLTMGAKNERTKEREMAHGTVQRDDVIDRRSRCYGIMIEADGNTGNGTSFHNDISAVIAAFMAIAGHYSKPGHAVRWRFQAERDRRTDGLCYRAFIDFGYAVKMRTALHWMPVGAHLEPVRDDDDIERAEGDCIRDDMRCGDDDEGLDMRPGPFIRFQSARRDGDAG